MKNKKILTDEEKHEQQLFLQLQEEDYSVDLNEEIQHPPVSISCGTYVENDFDGNPIEYEIPLGTDGNFSFIQAYPKVGKSFLLVYLYQHINAMVINLLAR